MGLLPTTGNKPDLRFDNKCAIIHGVPHIGKSMLLNDLPDVIYLSTEGRCDHLTAPKVEIESWEHFQKIVAELVRQDKYKTVVIDTVSNLWTHAAAAYCKRKGIADLMVEKYKEGFGICKNEIHRELLQLRTRGFGLWLIAHSYQDKVTEPIEGGRVVERVKWQAEMQWHLYAVIQKLAYMEFFMELQGDKRVIHPNPSEKWVAGVNLPMGASPLPDSIVIPSGASGYAVLKAEFEKAVKNLQG